INYIANIAQNSELFNELVTNIGKSQIPITVDTIDLEFMGFQAQFKPNLLEQGISERIERGSDDTDSTWYEYVQPPEPVNTGVFNGEITVNMSMVGAGNVHDFGFDFA